MWPWAFLVPAPPAAAADDPYCAVPKALYAWNCASGPARDGQSTWWHLLHDTNGCADRLVAFAQRHGVERVYLFVAAVQWTRADLDRGELPDEDAVADVAQRLRAGGVEPWALWYLNDDPDDLSGYERVDDLVAAVAAFDERHPDAAFAGLHGDQEPNDPAVYADYLAMNARGRAAAIGAGLGFGAALKPAWLTTEYAGEPYFHPVLDALTTGALMDYTDDPARAAQQGEAFLAWADGAGRRAEVALETGRGDPTPHVGFADLVEADPSAFEAAVVELDEGFAAHPSYDGVVIHDFAGYYAALHGVEPLDDPAPVDGPCPLEPPAARAPDRGCGCAAGPPTSVGWLIVAAAVGRSRRRGGSQPRHARVHCADVVAGPRLPG